MLKVIMKLMDAMKAGNELKNPAVWKNVQNCTSLVVVILTALVTVIKYKFPEVPITNEHITVLAGVVVTLFGLGNSVITTASSKKVSINPFKSK